MTYKTTSWYWEMGADCTVKGGTIEVNAAAGDDKPRICFRLTHADKCDSWTTVKFTEVESEQGTYLLFTPRGSAAEIRRGHCCDAHETQVNARCQNINNWDGSKRFKIEACVICTNGERKISYGYVDYKGTG
jgi:hypothetical protein